MDRPENGYIPGSVKYRLLDEDWSQCSAEQIADALMCDSSYVRNAVWKIKQETGYCVPYMRKPCTAKRPKPEIHIILPPSYQPKRKKLPRKCTTCWNEECAAKWRAVCWTECRGYKGAPEKAEAKNCE